MRSSITPGGFLQSAAFAIGLLAFSTTPRVLADQATATVTADAYHMDPSFSTLLETADYSLQIYDVKASADGGFFAVGSFSTIGGQLHLGLAKFRADGTVDPNFNRNGGFNGLADSIAVLPDGRLLVAGTFTSFNGTARPGLARINADGTLDTTFIPNSNVSSPGKIAVQGDGRILISGRIYSSAVVWVSSGSSSSGSGSVFNQLNADGSGSAVAPTLPLTRINADGSADPTFIPPAISTDGYLSCFALQPDGKILVGGTFSALGSSTFNTLARLNADGSVDTTFAMDSSLKFTPTAIAPSSDGKLFAGGYVYTYSGPSSREVQYLVRINSNGSNDATFHSSLSDEISIDHLLPQPDGKLVVGGSLLYYIYNYDPAAPIARLNTDGSLDSSFAPPSLGNFRISGLAQQTDGRFVAGGQRYTTDGTYPLGLVRLSPNGTPETIDTTDSRNPASQVVAVPLASGKFLVGGNFKWINGNSCNGIARLNRDGTVDAAFTPGSGFDGLVEHLVEQADGKILASGYFSTFNGESCGSIIRLNANGTRDTSFNPNTNSVNNNIYDFALQPDGKILLGGNFDSSIVLRINADGSYDTSFTSTLFTSNPLSSPMAQSLALQPDGKIVVGGNFQYSLGSSDPVTHHNLARFASNGSIDPTFNPGTGADNLITKALLHANGQVTVGGYFSQFNGTTRNFLARTSPQGSLDGSFDPGNGLALARPLAIQSDQRLFVALPIPSPGLARLDPTGAVDTSFSADDFNGAATSAALMSDGRLLVSGGMAIGSTTKQIGLTLLKSDSSPATPTTPETPSPAETSGAGGGGAPSAWFVLTAIALLAGKYARQPTTATTKLQA